MKKMILRLLRILTSDAMYCRIRFMFKFKRLLSLRKPDSFNAKLNWIKLNYRNPLLHLLVDKYRVRNFVKERIGEQYLIDMIGYYTAVDQIDPLALPNSFVLKGVHGSGWALVCKDQAAFDWEHARKEMAKWLHSNFYSAFGEWAYKDVPPGIICEKYMSVPGEDSLPDYKIYCFNGEPRLCHVDLDRFTAHSRVFYDLTWQRLPFSLCYPLAERDVPRPGQWEEMLRISRKLAEGLDFVRVDLYEISGKVYFGELTFTPGNGLECFQPSRYDLEIGKILQLNQV